MNDSTEKILNEVTERLEYFSMNARRAERAAFAAGVLKGLELAHELQIDDEDAQQLVKQELLTLAKMVA